MPDKQLHFFIDSDWDFKPPVVRIWIDNYLILNEQSHQKEEMTNI